MSRGLSHAAVICRSDLAGDGGRARLGAIRGGDIRPPPPHVAGGGRAIYIRDEDNHLFELPAGMLEERPAQGAEGRHA
ncbi:hypothetical protein RM543_07375 [Roseicyclus sp. F158]|uniref:VOC domain-containing protein n=1 Tax=Tropicimonas omnivorans TaxID=3075590 RepID=A0ABU3DG17_9RHOB|nr:hypothetical protein [Roseicyclus sp. F158]MDT0682499.1 hypothetical protein [Roseicyclus sp. F158]